MIVVSDASPVLALSGDALWHERVDSVSAAIAATALRKSPGMSAVNTGLFREFRRLPPMRSPSHTPGMGAEVVTPVAHAARSGASSSAGKMIDAMVRQIVEQFDPDRIVLFGSHARGTAGRDSDVDLLVVMEV